MNRKLSASTCAAVILLSAALVFVCGRTLAAAIASESTRKIIAFLQKHYRIPSAANITLSAPEKSPSFSKLWTRTLTVTDERGAANKITLFTDPGTSKIIVGEVLDLDSDPWGRVDLKSMHLQDRPTLGPADAPVTIVEFADFECPFCAHAMSILEPAVEGKYKDKARLIFKNYPLPGHQWAHGAAVAAECVRLQNPSAFWDFARDFYRDQASITPENLSQQIEAFARRNQLDGDTLHACMMGKTADDRIAQDLADGQAAHVASTPTLFVNGIPVHGLQDSAPLEFVVDSELKSQNAAR